MGSMAIGTPLFELILSILGGLVVVLFFAWLFSRKKAREKKITSVNTPIQNKKYHERIISPEDYVEGHDAFFERNGVRKEDIHSANLDAKATSVNVSKVQQLIVESKKIAERKRKAQDQKQEKYRTLAANIIKLNEISKIKKRVGQEIRKRREDADILLPMSVGDALFNRKRYKDACAMYRGLDELIQDDFGRPSFWVEDERADNGMYQQAAEGYRKHLSRWLQTHT